jgi:hypothetical protein
MNVAGLEQFHQSKSHDETDSRPFEASQSCLKHHADASAGKTDAQAESLRSHSSSADGEPGKMSPLLESDRPPKCIDCNPAGCLRSLL